MRFVSRVHVIPGSSLLNRRHLRTLCRAVAPSRPCEPQLLWPTSLLTETNAQCLLTVRDVPPDDPLLKALAKRTVPDASPPAGEVYAGRVKHGYAYDAERLRGLQIFSETCGHSCRVVYERGVAGISERAARREMAQDST